MKRQFITFCMAFLLLSFNSKNDTTMQTTKIFQKGQQVSEHFTGETHVQMLTVDGANFDAMSYNVNFAPGIRTDSFCIVPRAKGVTKKKGSPFSI